MLTPLRPRFRYLKYDCTSDATSISTEVCPPFLEKRKLLSNFWWCSLYYVCTILVGLDLWAPNRKPRPALTSFPAALAPLCCWSTLIATNWGTSRASSMLLWMNEPVQKSRKSLQVNHIICIHTSCWNLVFYYTIHNNCFDWFDYETQWSISVILYASPF